MTMKLNFTNLVMTKLVNMIIKMATVNQENLSGYINYSTFSCMYEKQIYVNGYIVFFTFGQHYCTKYYIILKVKVIRRILFIVHCT